MTKPATGRGGRPIKQPHEKRSIQIKLRVTIAEDDYYKRQAAAAGLTVAEYLRRAGLNIVIRIPPSLADDRLITEINAIGVNVNQIARAANRGQEEREFWRALGDKVANTLDEVVKKRA